MLASLVVVVHTRGDAKVGGDDSRTWDGPGEHIPVFISPLLDVWLSIFGKSCPLRGGEAQHLSLVVFVAKGHKLHTINSGSENAPAARRMRRQSLLQIGLREERRGSLDAADELHLQFALQRRRRLSQHR